MVEHHAIPLHQLALNQTARVVSLRLTGQEQRRILDFGLTRGAEVCPLYRSPSGNPVAYLVRGAVIALRTDVARRILVD